MAKRYYADKKAMKYSEGMISEDYSAPSLLPRNVIQKYYPSTAGYTKSNMTDLYDGVQKSMKEDTNELNRHTGSHK